MKKIIYLICCLAILTGCFPQKTTNERTISKIDSLNLPIKGIWITTSSTKVFDSRENIKEAVALCYNSGINNIYLSVYNSSRTIYPSDVMQNLIGVSISERFIGRDPLQEFIEEAHAKKIKVHAWFEDGFICSYNDPSGGLIIKNKPDWKALDSTGKFISKNEMYWLNSLDSEVQQFMLSLIKEVVSKYDIDGVQGDDRLSALASTGGYNQSVIDLYKQENEGEVPSSNHQDSIWVEWRAKKLTSFMKDIYVQVKDIKPNVVVSMAPTVYPLSKKEFLQDWPRWLENNYVDYLVPQIYKYDSPPYLETLKKSFQKLPKEYRQRVYPGVLLNVGDFTNSEEVLMQIVNINRKVGIKGEVFFYYEGLKKTQSFFQKYKKM